MKGSSRPIRATSPCELCEPLRKTDSPSAPRARIDIVEQLLLPFVPLLFDMSEKSAVDQISMDGNDALACVRLEAFVIATHQRCVADHKARDIFDQTDVRNIQLRDLR